MREEVQAVLAGEDAWVVGGAVRDELLGRPVFDLDIACREPERAARALMARSGDAVFPLSTQFGAWRVVLDRSRTVDFSPLQGGSIERDLARSVTSRSTRWPYRSPAASRSIRSAAAPIWSAASCVRLGARLRRRSRCGSSARCGSRTSSASGSTRPPRSSCEPRQGSRDRPAGERILDELRAAVGRRLRTPGRARPARAARRPGRPSAARVRLPWFRLARDVRREPEAAADLERPASIRDDHAACRGACRRLPARDLPVRRTTEPWALEALAFVGAPELADAVEQARKEEPAEPLLRGDELGIPPGREVGRLLELIAEERAAGTISTRAEAEELVRRSLE